MYVCVCVMCMCRHQSEMEEALLHVGESYRDDDINTLAQRHFDNMQVCCPTHLTSF